MKVERVQVCPTVRVQDEDELAPQGVTAVPRRGRVAVLQGADVLIDVRPAAEREGQAQRTAEDDVAEPR
ncbi:hypothetical protein ABE10_00560 [Bacillus toyonensis]|nr:hypothetical protein [Bacillus toyonensis]